MSDRRQDIEALLSSVYNCVMPGRGSMLSGEVDRVSVKNSLENLRSALEYLAHEAFDYLCELGATIDRKNMEKKVYFPYGGTPGDFGSSVGRSLPMLKSLAPKLYAVIESAQPFACRETWLVDLCQLTNFAKHNALSKTSHDTQSAVRVPGVFYASGVDLTFQYNRGPGGVPLPDVKLRGNHVEVIQGEAPPNFHAIVINDGHAVFEDLQIQVVPFLQLCGVRVRGLVTRVYSVLN